MRKTSFEIKLLKNDFNTPLTLKDLKNAAVVESASEWHNLVKIVISGEYCREYIVASDVAQISPKTVLIDGKLLFVILWSELAIIDMQQDTLLKTVEFDSWQLFSIYKFKTGYFIHGEDAIRYLNDRFELVWDSFCVDIFFNFKIDEIISIFDEYWTATDWCGYIHFFNEYGEFKCEYDPKYDCDLTKE